MHQPSQPGRIVTPSSTSIGAKSAWLGKAKQASQLSVLSLCQLRDGETKYHFKCWRSGLELKFNFIVCCICFMHYRQPLKTCSLRTRRIRSIFRPQGLQDFQCSIEYTMVVVSCLSCCTATSCHCLWRSSDFPYCLVNPQGLNVMWDNKQGRARRPSTKSVDLFKRQSASCLPEDKKTLQI